MHSLNMQSVTNGNLSHLLREGRGGRVMTALRRASVSSWKRAS